MDSFLRYENKSEPVVSREVFLRRLGRNAIVALTVIGVSMIVGIIGYHTIEGMEWIDAFLESAMLLGGMGPIHAPVTVAGKLFAGIYALYAGVLVIGTAGVILAPIFHRLLHSLHVEDDDDEKKDEKAATKAPARKAAPKKT
jgi:hypothetical protein